MKQLKEWNEKHLTSLFLSEMDTMKLIDEKENCYQNILTDEELVNAICTVRNLECTFDILYYSNYIQWIFD